MNMSETQTDDLLGVGRGDRSIGDRGAILGGSETLASNSR